MLTIHRIDNFDDGPCEVICRVPISTFSQGAIVWLLWNLHSYKSEYRGAVSIRYLISGRGGGGREGGSQVEMDFHQTVSWPCLIYIITESSSQWAMYMIMLDVFHNDWWSYLCHQLLLVIWASPDWFDSHQILVGVSLLILSIPRLLCLLSFLLFFRSKNIF